MLVAEAYPSTSRSAGSVSTQPASPRRAFSRAIGESASERAGETVKPTAVSRKPTMAILKQLAVLHPQAVKVLYILFDIVAEAFDDPGFQLPGAFFGDAVFVAHVFQG